ncbi:MAG: hypothetical protein QM607_08945 [Microbacterium sp.]
MGVFGVRGFPAYWTSTTLSGFGTTITTVAIPMLVVTTLHATPLRVGLVNAAHF